MSIEEPNDDELFDGAVEGLENIQPETTQLEQPEHHAEPETVTTEAERPTVDDNAPHVPSWRVREINEEKRALAEKVAALEAEKLQWQRPQTQQQTRTETPVQPPKSERPDPLLDPEGYEKYLESRVEERILNERRESSLQQAHGKYGKDFEEAYKTAQQNIDPALRARMQQSRDPGETLMQWHREQKTMREVGNDPNAWLQKKLDERLKDPEFLAKAVELARSGAAPQRTAPNARPAVELPPSLTSATRATTRASANDDLSDDDALFDSITG